jgi:hypothetical protein
LPRDFDPIANDARSTFVSTDATNPAASQLSQARGTHDLSRKAHRRKLDQERSRRRTLLKKADDFHELCDAEVYMVIHHKAKFYVYSSTADLKLADSPAGIGSLASLSLPHSPNQNAKAKQYPAPSSLGTDANLAQDNDNASSPYLAGQLSRGKPHDPYNLRRTLLFLMMLPVRRISRNRTKNVHDGLHL